MKNSTYNSHFFIFFIGLFFTVFQVFGQTGPAGTGSSANNRIWLDANALSLSDGATVASWNDLSGNGVSFTQGAEIREPLYTASGINGLPTVTFDGFNDVLNSGVVSGLETANLTYFIVYNRTTLTRDFLINASYSSNPAKWRSYMNPSTTRVINSQYSPGINYVFYTRPVGATFFSQHITPTSLRVYNQGTLAQSKSATYTVPSGHLNLTLGNISSETSGAGAYILDGDISEVIIYNTALNNLQRVLVENYLGAKYNMPIPTDLYAYESTHNIGLIAIGDNGPETQTEARGAGILNISGATDLGDNEYYVVAHTNESLNNFNDENIPAVLAGFERFERTWKLNETGEVGTTTLTFNLADGGADFAISATYRLLVDTDEDFTSGATAYTGSYNALAGTLTFTINLADGNVFTIAGVYEPKDINSIVDGPWSQRSTWDCNCDPSYRDNVNIHTGDEVTVDIDGFVETLTIESGATLTMDEDFTLNVYGDWDITGETNFTNGTMAFVGEINQDISILTVSDDTIGLYNILIDNEAGGDVTFLNRNYLLTGTVFPNAGNLVIDASTEFIIASIDATEGGRIGPILGSTTITGNFTVQRFIPPGIADWRDLASPVIGSTFDDWDPDLAMSGPGFPDGCAWGEDGCFQSVTYFDADAFIELENSTDPILNGRGFEIFVGSTLTSFDGTTLNSKGSINPSGDLMFTYGDGWSTIGNPYASPIAFSTLTKSPEIGNYFYVYDPAAGGFEWYDGASGTSSIPEITEDGLMAIGQAVWVFSTGVGTLTYSQANKVETNATYIREHIEDNSLHIALKENASTYSCTIYLEEMNLASDGVENDMDIRHLSRPTQQGPSFAVNIDETLLRKNYITEDGRDKSFKLVTEVKNEGFYTISAENWANFRQYRHIYLYDNETGQTMDLKERPYVYYAELNEDEKTQNRDRFTLILNNSENTPFTEINGTPTLESNTIEITQMDHVINVTSDEELSETSTISVINILGQTEVFSVQTMLSAGTNIITLPEYLKGFHIVTVRTGNQIISKKVVL